MHRAACLGFLGCVLLSFPVRAQDPGTAGGPLFKAAQDAPPPAPSRPRAAVRLEYTRTVDMCPDDRALRGAIAVRLGYDPVVAGPDALPVLHVSISRHGGGLIARAEQRAANGQVLWRRPPLVDPDCRHLVDVLGLSLAIALDPAAPDQAPAPVLQTTPPPEPAPGAPEAPPVVAAPSSSTRPRARLGLRAGLAVGTLPTPAATLAADIGVAWPVFSLNLEGRADLPVSADVAAGTRIRGSILAASLVPCGHFRWFAGCGVVSVGAQRAAGLNLDMPAEATGVYFAAGLRAGLEWPIPSLPKLALRAAGEVLVTLHPMVAARTDDRMQVWQAPPVAGLFTGGAVVHF